VRPSTRNRVVLILLAIGVVGLVAGLLAPLLSFSSWAAGAPSDSRTLLFSVGSPGAYFQSYVLGVGAPPPPQSTLDLDIVLWVDLALGVVAGIAGILRGVVSYRRDSVPALAQGATTASFGLAALATILLFAGGPAAYAPGTGCSSCTAYSGQAAMHNWSWTPEIGTIGVVLAAGAFGVALALDSLGKPDPCRWSGRLGAAGVVAGVALFSIVFGSNWQAWYPTGIPYLLLWSLIVAIPVGSAGFAARRIRWTIRSNAVSRG
jgi:hypothetical protein